VSEKSKLNLEINQLRLEVAQAAGKLRAAYNHEDWTTFHLQLGMLQGLGMRVYEANAKLDRLGT